MECFVCFETFNSMDLKPLLLPCGHTICSKCLQDVLSASRKCPYSCQLSDNLKEDINSYPVNFALLQMTENIELNCSEHPERLAKFINLSLAEAYCEKCIQNQNSEILVSFENFAKTLEKILSKLHDESILEENIKKRIRNCKKMTNKQKFCLLKEIKQRLNRLVCRSHSDNDAVAFDFKNHFLLCEICLNQESSFIKMLNTEEFQKEAISRIIWDQRAGQSSLNPHTTTSLRGMSMRDLVINLKFQSNEPSPVFNCKVCSRCNGDYEISNPPFVFPCPGTHIICCSCTQQKIECPFNKGIKFCINDLEPFFGETNRISCCEVCRKPFELYERVPKNLPCNHIVCLSCLKSSKEVQTEKKCPIQNCPKIYTEQSRSLPTNEFLIHKMRQNTIFCSRHKNCLARKLDLISLKSFCKKCERHESGQLVLLENSNSSIFSVFRVLSDRLSTSASFSFGSLQELLDEVRGLKDASLINTLRSSIPKGKIIEDMPHPNWLSSHSFAFRFFSVMPTKENFSAFEFITSPWVVDSQKGQVEAVSFRASSEIMLVGVLIGQVVNSTQARIDLIEIFEGKNLNGTQIYVNENNFPFTREPRFEYQNVMISKNVRFKANCFYSILVRIKGEGVLLSRGNPFDLKEEVFGSDGVKIEFCEVDEIGDFYLNGQHSITGPILGLVYQ